MTKVRNYILFLEDIQESMSRIQEYIGDMTFDVFRKDFKTIDAVIRNFVIIGEATKKLPTEFKAKYPQTPWSEMYRLRNRVTHEYFGVDYKIIWRIVTEYLPDNLIKINEIISVEKKQLK